MFSFSIFSENIEIINENTEKILLKDRGNWNRLKEQTISLGILSVGTMGLLYIMPESVSNWEEDKSVNEMISDWSSHIKEGPRFDPDDLFLNYIAHPYVGSAYYIVARKSDFNQFDSFLYSFFMSTFFWEYGIEAFAEIPSIQDLIITPVFGALMGEYLYRKEIEIRKNDSKVWNSKFLGKICLVAIDPIGTFASIIGFKDDGLNGMWTVNQVKTADNNIENTVGISFVYRF
jgi:hypothetical protein